MHASSAAEAPPLVTVVTAVRNGVGTLERNLESVLGQTWSPLEHIVVDGASTDGTLELIRRWAPHLRYVSEPDRGLYDAMNKGLGLVRDPGSYVVFLNADDTFSGADAVERVLRGAAGEDLIYARLERWDEELDYRDVIGREVTARDLVFGMRCHHQTIFCRRAVYDRTHGFDLHYRIAADYDWLVRAFQSPGVSRRFVPEVVSIMRRGGVSDRRYLASVRERWNIVRRHYGRFDLLRYSLWSLVGDYLRYGAQRLLKRAGLLNRARDVKRLVLRRP
jgi:glycosyltransferase involved in cell wall biosynthesis